MKVNDIIDCAIESILNHAPRKGGKVDLIDVLQALRGIKEEYGYLEVNV